MTGKHLDERRAPQSPRSFAVLHPAFAMAARVRRSLTTGIGTPRVGSSGLRLGAEIAWWATGLAGRGLSVVAARLSSWRGPASSRTGRRWPPVSRRCVRCWAGCTRPGRDRLGPMFAELDELKLLAEAGQVGVLGEGLSRGDVRESDAASPAGWVRHWGHSYLAGGAAALVAVTVAIAQERNRVLREAVLAARAPVRNAAVAMAEMDKLRPPADPGVPRHGAGGVRGAGRGAGPARDPGAAPGADRQVRPPGGVPAPRGPAQARHRPVPALRR